METVEKSSVGILTLSQMGSTSVDVSLVSAFLADNSEVFWFEFLHLEQIVLGFSSSKGLFPVSSAWCMTQVTG